MFCKNCGQEIAEGNSFCAHCGTKFDLPPSETMQPVRPKKKKKVIWIVLGIILVLFIIVGVLGSSDTGDSFIRTVKEGAFDEYPSQPIGKAFSDFFASPSWGYFATDDKKDVVEFTGICEYMDSQVTVTLQYEVFEDASFELSYADMDGKGEFTASMYIELMERVFSANNTDTKNSSSINESDININKSEDVTSGEETTSEVFKLISTSAQGFNNIFSHSTELQKAKITQQVMGERVIWSGKVYNVTEDKVYVKTDDYTAVVLCYIMPDNKLQLDQIQMDSTLLFEGVIMSQPGNVSESASWYLTNVRFISEVEMQSIAPEFYGEWNNPYNGDSITIDSTSVYGAPYVVDELFADGDAIIMRCTVTAEGVERKYEFYLSINGVNPEDTLLKVSTYSPDTSLYEYQNDYWRE